MDDLRQRDVALAHGAEGELPVLPAVVVLDVDVAQERPHGGIEGQEVVAAGLVAVLDVPEDAKARRARHLLGDKAHRLHGVEVAVDLEQRLHALVRGALADLADALAGEGDRLRGPRLVRDVVAEHAQGGDAHARAHLGGLPAGADVLLLRRGVVELAGGAKAHDLPPVRGQERLCLLRARRGEPRDAPGLHLAVHAADLDVHAQVLKRLHHAVKAPVRAAQRGNG